MAKVKLGLKNLSPDELVALANTIKTAMTGNANFTTPNPALTAIGTLITTAQTKIGAYNSAKAAADTALADRDTALVALRAGLTQEGDYVQNITNGDKTKIESAGMSTRDDAAPIGTPTQVLSLVVTAGDFDGTLDASWDPVRGAQSYEIQIKRRSNHAEFMGFQTDLDKIQRDHSRADEWNETVGASPGDWRGQHTGTMERSGS
jgi:hypothetical protein